MPSTIPTTLPTPEELDAAARDLTAGFNSIERTVYRISKVGNEWEETSGEARGEAPTLEQIGRLFSFGTLLKNYADLIRREIDDLDVALENLDCLRLDAEVQGRA
jgi:hypothetical protein